jgi:hypothetical protein
MRSFSTTDGGVRGERKFARAAEVVVERADRATKETDDADATLGYSRLQRTLPLGRGRQYPSLRNCQP